MQKLKKWYIIINNNKIKELIKITEKEKFIQEYKELCTKYKMRIAVFYADEMDILKYELNEEDFKDMLESLFN